jgi:hypothetical protein
VLLEQRLEVVRDASRARDMRTAWVLASQKLAELELDKTLWTGQQTQSNGDFGTVDPAFSSYYWDYQIVRLPIEIADPNDPERDRKPRELLKLTLVVRAPGMEDPIVLEAEFPIWEDKPEASATAPDSKDPATGQPTPPGVTPPPAGGNKK